MADVMNDVHADDGGEGRRATRSSASGSQASVTEAKLREFVRFAAPSGLPFSFTVVRIPQGTRTMELQSSHGERIRVPLRNKPGDLRCALVVGDRLGQPIYATAIEMDGGIAFAVMERNVAECYAAILRELKRDGY